MVVNSWGVGGVGGVVCTSMLEGGKGYSFEEEV